MDLRPLQPAIRPLVLIVEGHDDTCALYALALSASGFDVVAVQDVAEAGSRAWKIQPDIIVTDLSMPNGDRWQFLQDLKQSARTRDIPVVAVSGYAQRSRGERTEHDGFAASFPKSCLPDELAAGLRDLLNRKAHASAR